jgi:integrase-like protein
MDNGPEFTGRALFAWSARTGVRLRFIQPGKPIQNAFVESFIGRFRDECLNQHWFGCSPRPRGSSRPGANTTTASDRTVRSATSRRSGSRAGSARLDSMKLRAPRRRSLRRRARATTSTAHLHRGSNFGGSPHRPFSLPPRGHAYDRFRGPAHGRGHDHVRLKRLQRGWRTLRPTRTGDDRVRPA